MPQCQTINDLFSNKLCCHTVSDQHSANPAQSAEGLRRASLTKLQARHVHLDQFRHTSPTNFLLTL